MPFGKMRHGTKGEGMLSHMKVIRKMFEVSQSAERMRKYKERKATVDILYEDCPEQNLWAYTLRKIYNGMKKDKRR